MAQSATVIDKYRPSQGGIGGLWNQTTAATGSLFGSVAQGANNLAGATGNFGDWGNALIYGGVAVIGVVLILIAFSFTTGKQNIAQIATAVKPGLK
jgi:hypothetical protein